MSKRILMLLEREFPPDVRVEKEIAFLNKNEVEVHILTYTHKNAPALEKKGLLTIHRKPISSLIYKSSVAALWFPAYFRFWDRFIARITDQYPFQAIQVHDLPLARLGIKWGKKRSIPCILDLHENWPALLRSATHTNTLLGKLISHNRTWVAYEKKMIRAADAVITVCDEMKERMSVFSSRPEKFFVYQNVIEVKDEYRQNRYTPPSGTIKMVYLGGVNQSRGIQTVVEAISLLPKETDIEFTIIGNGSYLDELKACTRKLKMEDRVHFTGYMPQEQALEKVREHHIAVIPHYCNDHTNNTFPNKIVQYMVMGVPVVSSNCAPLTRLISQHQCGICYQDQFANDLAEKLQELISAPSELSRYSHNGHQAVLKELNAEKENEKLAAVYQWLKIL